MNDLRSELLDVLIVGAGLSGIDAAHHIQTTCPWASYTIVEARPNMGGTWDLFRYPGIRSDSDMYTLGFPWRPWTGERAIADGEAIRDYIVDAARAEGIDQNIRYEQRVTSARWSTADSLWSVTVDSASGDTTEIQCRFLMACTGYYRYDKGHTPVFADQDLFAGQIIHPQFWPDDFDGKDRNVVVIGSGATAVTLIPALAETVGHVTMLQRSPSYVASVPYIDPIAKAIQKVLPARWSGSTVRWMAALRSQGLYKFCRRYPDRARALLRKGVERNLPEGYDIDTHFNPKYGPWDQRLCADPDGHFFKAIETGKASVVTDEIDRFTRNGVLLESGVELAADIVVTATGLELMFVGGMELEVDGEPVDISQRLAYKGMMLEGVPNFMVVFGYTNASWTLRCDLACDYAARLLNEMRRRGQTKVVPRNDQPEMGTAPMLDLSSGYVKRSADRLPRRGERAPWQITQSYWSDYRELKRGDLIDDALELSTP